MASLTPEDRIRRRSGKLFNERLKLVANVFNAGCIGVLGAALIVPGVTGIGLRSGIWVWIMIAGALHLLAQATLSFYKSED